MAPSPYQSPTERTRNSNRAQDLTADAIKCLHEDSQRAESLLREALAEDLFHGPAHNNLAVLLLRRDQYYEAAHEFEWARKLMPGHPDPRLNLGLTLEKAGKIDEALCQYSSALDVYPGHVPSMQALTRLQVRHRKTDERTRDMLGEVALAGENDQWREWAKLQLIRMEREVE